MSFAIALVQLLLPLMPKIVVGAEELWKFIDKTREAAQQTGEWKPEIEAAYQQSLLDTKTDPAYQPDAPA